MAVTTGLPFAFGSSPAVWIVGFFALLVWMAFHPHENFGPKVVIYFLVYLLISPVAVTVMDVESARFPLRFDYFLYAIDKALGISAFAVARLLTPRICSALYQLYELLGMTMLFWYAVSLKRKEGRPNTLLIAYVVAYVTGVCLYMALPACGPRHAFGSAFPLGDPAVSLVLVKLPNWPNAISSLHVATALLFVLFAGRSRALRLIAWTFLAGTVLATLAFEHYVIDLIVAVPFACFAKRAAEGKFRQAAQHFALVMAWMLAIRYITPVLVAWPVLLRALALGTVAFPVVSMRERRWQGRSPAASWLMVTSAGAVLGAEANPDRSPQIAE